jgi:hypothetical protein
MNAQPNPEKATATGRMESIRRHWANAARPAVPATLLGASVTRKLVFPPLPERAHQILDGGAK